MAWALFVTGAFFALFAVHSHRPLRRPGGVVLSAWFASWITTELPFHGLVMQIAIALTLVALGALDDWPGLAGLALFAISWIAHVRHCFLSQRTTAVVERALAAGLGPAYRSRIDRGRMRATRSAAPRWWRIARVFPIRRPEVERVRNIEYCRVDGRSMRLDVYRHRSHPEGCPVLLYVHGGVWVIGNKGQQGLVTVNHLASRGWVCVSINYRLSPRATFPDHLLDVKRAIVWTREHVAEYGGDPSFLVLAGGSAGAHLSALSALTPNALEYQRDHAQADTAVQGCVAYYGVYDFTDRHGHWKHRTFRMLLERVIMKRSFEGARPEYEKASPIYCVGAHAPAFFLIHGDRDNLAPVGEARRFAEALRESSKAPVVYAELPGAQHAFELFPSVRSLKVMDAVEYFCEHLYARHRSAGSRGHTA